MCSIITWRCPKCGLAKVDPPNLEELRKKCPNCGNSMELPTKEPAGSDRRATQVFAIFNVLTGHCDKDFSADKIEAAMKDIEKEMSEGGCAWAFEGPAKDGTPSWYHDGNCICQSSPPGFVAKDGVHCGMCGGTLRPCEPLKTVPQAYIDELGGDEAALLKEHQERESHPMDGDRPGFDDPRESLAEPPPPPAGKKVRCCRECVSFHRSITTQFTSLSDPDAPNDGCVCRCHDPSTPEGAALTKHFDSLDLQDEVDKMEDAPERQSNGQPPKASANGTKDVPSETLATRAPTECNHCAGTGEAKLDKDGNELYNGVMGKCPYCSPPDEELCPTCNGSGIIPETGAGCHSCKGRGIAPAGDPYGKDWDWKKVLPPKVPDDMIGRGGTDPNERE